MGLEVFRLKRRLLVSCFLLQMLCTAALGGQAPGFSTGAWKRVETEHFVFFYPEELTDWTHSIARRMEGVHDRVGEVVGFVPEERIKVLVDDPFNAPNGAMYSGPLIYLWPTPPTPRSLTGENRGWAEIVAVHEFAHAAHLTRPSRNPARRFLISLVPVPVFDIMQRAPRWLREGYATYIEGEVTGSGRPYGVWRPAVMRTWALEGQLPTYGAMNFSGGYYGGSMAYLVGSAFLEWLIEREDGNDEVLVDFWRRLTARQRRSMSGAFAGVFGASPTELYGDFRVDVTERALAMRDALEAAGGVADGSLFQRLSWTTGDPAVSPDGEFLAVALRSRTVPSRLVVMSTTPDTLTEAQRQYRDAIYEADPEDVRPVERRPRPQRRLATLHATNGRGYSKPAFLPDGEHILVVRNDLVENSRSRPDLFEWAWRSGDLRRITNGAAIREASPAPDASWAVGVQCLHGKCNLVRIDLVSGEIATIAQGEPDRPYYHPRVSPDGESIVAAKQQDGLWRLVRMDADGSNERYLGPDDGASRFDAEFVEGSSELVLSSTVGGIHNLELLHLATERVRPLTRVLSAAVAPAPTSSGDVFFLALHSRGWDLRRTAIAEATPAPPLRVDASLAPAAPKPGPTVPPLAETELGPVESYGLGPRYYVPLPLFDGSVQGWSAGLALRSVDPIGNLAWHVRGMYGSSGGWRGGSAELLWRGFQPWIRIQAFGAEGPTAIGSEGPTSTDASWLDDDYLGGAAMLEVRRGGLSSAHRLLVGGSAGRLSAGQNRFLGFAEYGLGLLQMEGRRRFSQSLGFYGAIGRTGSFNWTTWRVSGSAGARLSRIGLNVTGLISGTDAPSGSAEILTVGGTQPKLFHSGITPFRVAQPALPVGTLRGDQVRIVQAEMTGGLPFKTFFWTGDAVGDGRDWYRLIGLEFERSLAEMSYLRLPSVRARLGLARMLSDPNKGDWRFWATVVYRP